MLDGETRPISFVTWALFFYDLHHVCSVQTVRIHFYPVKVLWSLHVDTSIPFRKRKKKKNGWINQIGKVTTVRPVCFLPKAAGDAHTPGYRLYRNRNFRGEFIIYTYIYFIFLPSPLKYLASLPLSIGSWQGLLASQWWTPPIDEDLCTQMYKINNNNTFE